MSNLSDMLINAVKAKIPERYSRLAMSDDHHKYANKLAQYEEDKRKYAIEKAKYDAVMYAIKQEEYYKERAQYELKKMEYDAKMKS